MQFQHALFSYLYFGHTRAFTSRWDWSAGFFLLPYPQAQTIAAEAEKLDESRRGLKCKFVYDRFLSKNNRKKPKILQRVGIMLKLYYDEGI